MATQKVCNILVSIIDKEEWSKWIERGPSESRSFSQLKWLARKIFDPEKHKWMQKHRWDIQLHHGLLNHCVEECGEVAYYELCAGLSNPSRSKVQKEDLETDIDADTPTLI